jgi:hypothetical protein
MAKKSSFKLRFTLDRKLTLPVFIITAVLAVVLRAIQLLENYDLATGIYKNRDIKLDYPVMVIIAGLVLILLLLIVGSSKDKMAGSALLVNPLRLPVPQLNKNFKVAAGSFTLIAAGTMLFQIFMDVGYIVQVNTLVNNDIPDKREHISLLTGMGGADVASYLFMLIAGITCITMGANMIKEEGISSLNCFFLLFMLAWKVFSIYNVFFTAQEETRIINLYSDKLYTIFSGICMIFLLIYVIRVFAQMEEKFSRIALIFWGYATAIVTAVSAIPPLFCLIYLPLYKNIDETGVLVMPDISDFGVLIMAIVFIVPFFSGFSYREMAKMTYREGRRDNLITGLAVQESDMEGIDIDTILDDDGKPIAEKKKSSNIDELF